VMCFLFSLLYDVIFCDGSYFFVLFYTNNLTCFRHRSMCLFYNIRSLSQLVVSPVLYLDAVKRKGLPQQAEVAQGVPGRLRPGFS
jgi:hypothetical protein